MKDKWVQEFYNAGNDLLKLNSKQKMILEENVPPYLCQYRPINDYNVNNIINNVIWAAKANRMNDPYDCLFSSEITTRAILKAKRIGKDDLVPQLVKILEKQIDIQNEITDITVLSCFSTNQDSLLMWSHYADKHKGMCIIYNFKDVYLWSIGLLRPVDYGKKICTSHLSDEGEIINCSNLKQLLVRKAIEWKYENEWRIINTIQEKERDEADKFGGLTVRVPNPKLVIFGAMADLNCKLSKDLISHCKSENIAYSQMVMASDEYKLYEVDLSKR